MTSRQPANQLLRQSAPPVVPLAAYVSASVVFVLATWEGCMESLSSLSPTGLVQAMMSQSAEATSEDEPAVQQVIVRWSQVFLETVQDNRLAVMSLLNVVLCSLILLGLVIVRLVFRSLRPVETQMMAERIIKHGLFKVVFVGAIIKPRLEEIFLWTSWFMVMGFLRLIASTVRDRVEFMTFSSANTRTTFVRFYILLALLVATNVALAGLAVSICYPAGLFAVALVLHENLVSFIESVQILYRFSMHLKSLQADEQGLRYESRDHILSQLDIASEISVLGLELMHFGIIIYLNGIIFSSVDIILLLYVRYCVTSLFAKLIQYYEFYSTMKSLDSTYADASPEDLAHFEDNCAICREAMVEAKRLPCGHLFHLACLRAWLLQHASCPTCRWSPNHGHHGFTAAQLATLLSAAFPETHADDLRHQQHGDGHQPRLHPEQQVEIDGIQEPLATLEEVFVPPIVPEQPREQQTPKRRDVRQPVLTSPRLTRSGISRRLNTLQLRLPHVSTNILEAALLDCDGDVDLVFERLSNHT